MAEGIKRRGFLAGILASACAPAFVGSGILMPVRKIWVPEAVASNGLLTISMITKEALRILEDNLFGVGYVEREYRELADQWTAYELSGASLYRGKALNIRRPARFTVASL